MELLMPVGDSLVPITITPPMKPIFRWQYKGLARHFRGRAKRAGNAATLAYTWGGSIGGGLAVTGVVALAMAVGPLTIAGLAAASVGLVVATAGTWVGYRMNNIRARLEESAELYSDLAEEIQ